MCLCVQIVQGIGIGYVTKTVPERVVLVTSSSILIFAYLLLVSIKQFCEKHLYNHFCRLFSRFVSQLVCCVAGLSRTQFFGLKMTNYVLNLSQIRALVKGLRSKSNNSKQVLVRFDMNFKCRKIIERQNKLTKDVIFTLSLLGCQIVFGFLYKVSQGQLTTTRQHQSSLTDDRGGIILRKL